MINQNKNRLDVTISSPQEGVFAYEYSVNPPVVKPGDQVAITNTTETVIYLESTGDKACPFTEAWPACIPVGETVVRKIPVPTKQIPTPLVFPFSAYDLSRPGIYGERLVGDTLGDPSTDGEIIVENQ